MRETERENYNKEERKDRQDKDRCHGGQNAEGGDSSKYMQRKECSGGGGDKRLEVKRVTEGKNDTRKEYELCESIKKIIYKKWVYWE